MTAVWALLALGCSSGVAGPDRGTLDGVFDGADAGRPRVVVRLVKVAGGFEQPTDIQAVPGRRGELVVLEKAGRALRVRDGQASPWLEIDARSPSEMGLLGLAFHPAFPENGRFFLSYNPKSGSARSRVEEWHAAADLSDPRPVKVVLEVDQPYANHDGGDLEFGPDGMLYFGLGDGGAADDPHGNGQDTMSLLGAVVRLDVDTAPAGAGYAVPADNPFVDKPGHRPEIWVYGVRNPWRFAFDPGGRLVIADVGQNLWEEVSIARKGDNLGWNLREAAHCFPPRRTCTSDGLVEPVWEYGHDEGRSITGGHVASGTAAPALRGRYVLGDFATGRLWALDLPSAVPGAATVHALGRFAILPSTFALDHDGDVLVADFSSGSVFELVEAR